MFNGMTLFRLGCALIAAAVLMAMGGDVPLVPSIVLTGASAAVIYGALYLVETRVAASARDYGYLAIGSLLLIMLVVLPSRSGGHVWLGLISWAVITALVGAVIHYYRKTPLS